jgi:hypothetical protein
MKDHYRWYNSALFEQREALGERYPELAGQLQANKSLRPFLDRPAHLAQQDSLSAQASLANKQAPENQPQQQAKLFVCCPQEDNLARHGTGYLPLNTNEQAANVHNAPHNGSSELIRKEPLLAVRRVGAERVPGAPHDVHERQRGDPRGELPCRTEEGRATIELPAARAVRPRQPGAKRNHWLN